MNRAKFHRIGVIAPFACSLLALALVLFVLATGWERQLADEGTSAHLFQLLVVVQVPLIIGLVLTSGSDARRRALRTAAAQCAALSLPLGIAATAGL